ncbi:hypothetical protein BC827DRAFT_1171690 [Russula dissimulans]|nr:hypothetical protein BC827DRAFT_1171690 [Russula dissimulans]
MTVLPNEAHHNLSLRLLPVDPRRRLATMESLWCGSWHIYTLQVNAPTALPSSTVSSVDIPLPSQLPSHRSITTLRNASLVLSGSASGNALPIKLHLLSSSCILPQYEPGLASYIGPFLTMAWYYPPFGPPRLCFILCDVVFHHPYGFPSF